MITETTYNKRQAGAEARVLCDDGMDNLENFQAQLEEARFISNFMTTVCTSLEIEGICSLAARVLYTLAPYCRIVFSFSPELESRSVVFCPASQQKIIVVRSKNSVAKACPGSASVGAYFNLQDNLGSIAIYYKDGQDKLFSASLHANISACFSQAIRNALQHSKVKDLAMRDGLTGLFNRRIFDETLARQATSPSMRPVSLLIFDLDNFKQLNDTFGHRAGDQVLQSFAEILKESCRSHDLVARFGGEEFAIVLSQTTSATACTIAQRIRNRLAKTVFTFDGRDTRITVSVGLATCGNGNAVVAANLVEQADQALYSAKRTGKNRVCIYPLDLLLEPQSAFAGERFCPLTLATC